MTQPKRKTKDIPIILRSTLRRARPRGRCDHENWFPNSEATDTTDKYHKYGTLPNGRGMKLLELCVFALTLVLPDNSQADTTVKSYTRKNGTEVPSYTRRSGSPGSNGDSNVATPASQPVQVYTTPEIPLTAAPSAHTLSPAEVLDNEIAAGLPAATGVTYEITGNEWKSDTLVVHGTLTNTSSGSVDLTTPALIGYDGQRPRNQRGNSCSCEL